ncbi:MAG: histidine kinase dimerization/phospho-acceptor domain-containing protein, partial [Desulfobacterales bacterium]|nr:histidine kinase dimerization/phospho-acceptor domain-containing protein [Desulfobacterales bacterium]
MDDKRIPAELDFKGLRHSKIGYFKEVRAKIKELEKLNLQLAQRHNRLDAIFNSMSDGVTILNRDLNVVFTNRVQREMFPDIADSPKHCHQIFYQRDARCPDCPALKTMASGEMLRGEHMFKKGHLANRFYEWTTSPIAGPRGQVDEIILIMRDITERKEYEFRAMQDDRMVSIGFLATSLAHEINNPLTSIAGFSEGLLKRLKNQDWRDDGRLLEAFKEYLEIINSEAYRCKDIIQNLREFSS